MEETSGTEQQRPDYISQIWSLCTTLSTEALESAESRARDNKFNIDRGDVTFAELEINLSSAREVLKDAIEKEKLIQLPLTVQKELVSDLQSISRALQGIMGNSDEIVNLGAAVEELNTSIWKYGLHNLSDQVLGYQTKLNQIKQQEVRIKQLLSALEKAGVVSENLAKASAQVEQDRELINQARLASDQEVSTIALARQQAQEETTKASNAATTSLQAEAQIAQYAATAKTSIAEITPLETSIKGFFTEIDGYRRQIAESTDQASKFLSDSNAMMTKIASENNARITAEIDRWNAAAKSATDAQSLALSTQLDGSKTEYAELVAEVKKKELARIAEATAESSKQLAQEKEDHSAFVIKAEEKLTELELGLKSRSAETIEENTKSTAKLIEELALLKESIREQLAQATGFGQFGAFQSRQNTISLGKRWWVAAIGALVFAVVSLTYFIALHAQQGDLRSAAFYIKLSMNIPLGFLIGFCTLQYSRERRLEEEYAFKASISVSLTPYRELIYSILEKEGSHNDGSYTSFIVDSVRNVFTSPTEKIFDPPREAKGISEKTLKATAELIGTVVKAAK